MASLRFHAFQDSAPALRALRDRGIRTVVVSNWDWSLHERLQETGLAELVDGALASAEIGSAKPDGAIFAAALRIAGTGPGETWHVGDTPEADVEGARAAGIRPVLIARDESRPRSTASPRSDRCPSSYPCSRLDDGTRDPAASAAGAPRGDGAGLGRRSPRCSRS